MRILVTGSRGFTGQHLCSFLYERGHDVIELNADLTDLSSVSAETESIQPEWVIHLAGVSSVTHRDANDFYQSNVIGTRNLLEALDGQDAIPKAVLLASSGNVYGNRAGGKFLETSPFDPVNDYAFSKVAMELMARLWTDKLPIIVTRPFNYTGPKQTNDFLVPKLVDHFSRRAPILQIGNLDVEREFNDVRMVCESYLALLSYGKPGEVYNVCSGRPYTLVAVIDLLSELTSHRIKVERNSAYVRKNEVRQLYGDPTKLQKLLREVKASPPCFTLRDTLNWMLCQART